MIKEIQKRFNKVYDKKGFILHMAKLLNLKPASIANNHLGGWWAIPEKDQQLYITELDKWLEKEKVKS